MNLSGIERGSLLGKSLRAPLKVIPGNMTVPILQGKLRGKRWVVGAGVHGYWLGSYEWDKRRALEDLIAPGSTFFDVGANVGFYTLLAAELVGPTGNVVAFEPLPRNIRYLETHVRINRIQNVTISRTAVWEHSGEVCFAAGVDASQGSVGNRGEIDVKATSLDEFVAERPSLLPDVIKMDIEGGELHALRGAAWLLGSHSPVILLATHGPLVHRQCCDLLDDFGYTVSALLSHQCVSGTDELIARKR